jgi:DNA-binding MarR family transcriptional regulator
MRSADSAPTAVPAARLSPHEARAWRAMLEASTLVVASIERDLNDYGFTLGDFRVLMFLSRSDDGAMRMSALAELLHLSPSGLTRRLDGLVRAGYVVRQGLRSDRRVMMAVLTDEGRAALARVAPAHVASVRRRVFDHLSDVEIDVLERVCSRLVAFEESDQLAGSVVA